MTSSSELPQFLRDLIGCPPQAGSGVNSWLYRVARHLHHHRQNDEIVELLRAAADGCGRHVPEREITRAVENSRATAWSPTHRDNGNFVPRQKWPAIDRDLRAKIVRKQLVPVADLEARSPIALGEHVHADAVADHFYTDSDLLCVGKSSSQFATRARSTWRGRLAGCSLIVPSPMASRSGKTKEGRLSEHSLENTGPRRWLVVEFDLATHDRSGNPTLDHDWVTDARQQGISIADICSSLLCYLAGFAPLTCVCASGGKSLHGWFPTAGTDEDTVRRFFRHAAQIGADPATWTRSQFCRIPGGTRENGRPQTIHYFNPDFSKI